MNVPAKLQIFDRPVSLGSKDEERLSPFLVGWEHLHPVLGSLNEPDLQRLIILELMGKQRRKIVQRLLFRLGGVHKDRIRRAVERLLPKGPSRAAALRR